MKKFLENQKAFIAKASELLKNEEFEALVKSLEEHSEEISALEKSLEKDEEEKEELEKKAQEDEAEKEKARIKKYAELFANADDLTELLEQFKEAQTLITKLTETNEGLVERLVVVEKASKWSAQPQEPVAKQVAEDKADEEIWNALLGR